MPNPVKSRRVARAGLLRALALLLPVCTACGRTGAASRPEHPERLAGEWTMELRLEHPAALTRDTTGLAPVRGRAVLLESRGVRAAGGPAGVPTHVGAYSADLRPLGLGGARVPTLAARLIGRGSVEIAFGPDGGGALVGEGSVAGDSVVGHWWTRGGRTAGRSSGRFVMRRRQGVRSSVGSPPQSRTSGRRYAPSGSPCLC